MSKQKMFIYLFGGISLFRAILNSCFPGCFIFTYVWLLYLLHFLIIGITFLRYFPTVSAVNSAETVECIMLGNGTVTDELFDRRKYSGYSLIYSSQTGNAYSAITGEMMYTKKVKIEKNGHDTVISLVLFVIFYTIIGLYAYYILTGCLKGNINISELILHVIIKIKKLNIFSDIYPISKNLRFVYSAILLLIHKLLNYIIGGVRIVLG